MSNNVRCGKSGLKKKNSNSVYIGGKKGDGPKEQHQRQT